MYKRELEIAAVSAQEAALAIKTVAARAQKTAQQKSGGQGPVTEADLLADDIIRKKLVAAFPSDVVVTEETWQGESAPKDGRVWFVDPLDGTQEFINGNDDYIVMIGLVENGVPVVGALCHPPTSVLYCAARGQGATRYHGGKTTALHAAAAPGMRIAVSRSHPSKLTRFITDELGGSVVKRGSVGLKVALITDGEADAYLSGSTRMKLWDSAGPNVILAEAGGRMSALDGSPLCYTAGMTHSAGIFAGTNATRDAFGPRIDAAIATWRARL